MDLEAEIAVLRRSLAGVNDALRPLRERPATRRLVQRLDADVRRMQEDVDDLAADGPSDGARAVPRARDFEPIGVPPRDPATGYDPECEDEGIAGWRSPVVPHPPEAGRRR